MSKVRRKKSTERHRTVPYARGFAPPTAKQRDSALGLRGLKPALAQQLQPGEDAGLFVPVPPPTSIDDWLAQYKEEGQTYSQYLSDCPWLSDRKVMYYKSTFIPSGKSIKKKYPKGKIYILPLNSDRDSPTAIAPKFEDLADYTQRFYSIPVEVLPAVQLKVDTQQSILTWDEDDGATQQEKSSYRKKLRRTDVKIRFHEGTGNFQLKADTLLGHVKRVMPKDALVLMALTSMDVYCDEPDLFVAGLAGGNSRAGVFSLMRYDPSLTFSTEHWYDISTNKSKTAEESRETTKVMLQRSIKLLVHEIAHLLGVDHCIWYSCCMNGSGHLAEDFRQSMHLCPVDLRKLQQLCGFDIPERYSKLAEFFVKHDLTEERDWVEKRLKSIGQ